MASYFGSYFQTTSMPKRLLQYALSRLEILETDALDLENLEIAWGRESVFEFKNVGLRLKKLEAFLQLPPSFELAKANILLLRLTIPVDIYSSPIRVDVDGVESQLRVKSQADIPRTRTDHDRKRKRTFSKPTETKPSHTGRHNARTSSDFTEDELVDAALPSATDLAESFLQSEPQEERAELEAALLSETTDIGSSSVLSDDGEVPLGTGTTLSLPAFMARFLNNIVDRLQITIRNITINLDVELPNESVKPRVSNSTDSVTVQLRVEDVKVEGVTNELDEKSKSDHKLGKRLVELSSIRGFLISEANFFSSLARSSALSSPSAAHSDIFVDGQDSSSPPPIQRSIATTFDGTSSPEPTESLLLSKDFSVASLPTRSVDLHALSNSVDLHTLSNSVVASDNGRFDDAPEDDNESILSASMHSERNRVTNSSLGDSTYLGEGTESRHLRDLEDEEIVASKHSSNDQLVHFRTSSTPSTPRASIHLSPTDESGAAKISTPPTELDPAMLESTVLPRRPHNNFSEERVSYSQSSLVQASVSLSRDHTGSDELLPIQSVEPHHLPHGIDENEEESSPTNGEDLTQSQLFSHEDAESMYMSAISHVSSRPRVPGGWAKSSSGSEGTASAPGSPSLTRAEEISRDNLEHARHNPPPEKFEEGNTPRTWSSDSEDSTESKSLGPPLMSQKQHISTIPQSWSNSSEQSNISPNDFSRLTKQFLNLDRVLIYLPGISSENETTPAEFEANSGFDSKFDGHGDPSHSTSINVPGAFSAHLPSPKSPPRHVPVNAEPVKTKSKKETKSNEKSIELDIGHLSVQFDISIGRIVFKLVQQLKEVIRQNTQVPAVPNKDSKPLEMEFSMHAKEISLEFLERLQGTLGLVDNALEEAPASRDVLLQTKLTDLQINMRNDDSTTKTSLSLGKFVFGYAQENIISFDKTLQLGASVRDLNASAGIDVSAHITQSVKATRCEISTLPMHVSIDLRRLDETFSWFGGLSSVLNLGSSIASNATVTASSPTRTKPRGVRFETPIRPDDKSMAVQNKADVRIGGFILDLVGTECKIGLETSAVKIVSRDEGIGLSIQKIRLSGPHLKEFVREPAITIEVTSTRIEYLASPKDSDLDRLLSLITPSKSKYDQDDDILIDTLLRQRKQGAVLRLTVEDCHASVAQLHELKYLPELGEEVSRLATVAKYLPEDDRPGLLSLISVRKFNSHVDLENGFGSIQLSSSDIEVAQITLPSLIALSVGGLSAQRNNSEEILGTATDPRLRDSRVRVPAVMARMIGDEMDPTLRIKLWNLKFEYRVATLITLLGLTEQSTSQDITASLSASVATLTDLAKLQPTLASSRMTARADVGSNSSKLSIDVIIRDCILGLNPLGLPSKVLVVLTEAHLKAVRPRDESINASIDLSKASILVIDDVANVGMVETRPRRQSFDGGSNQVADLCSAGYVSVSYISSARALIQVINNDGESSIDVELRDDLFVLESCADSTQTLIAVLNGLSPPTPPTKEIKYRTKVIPVQDLLASLSGDAFGTAEGDYDFDEDFGIDENAEDFLENDEGEFNIDSNYYQEGGDILFDETDGNHSSISQLTTRDTQDGVLLDSIVRPNEDEETGELNFQDDHFGTGSVLEGTAHRWNSAKNTYDRSNAAKIRRSPLKVCVRDVHIIWNLFDGYDWQHTRDKIAQAVQDVESKAIEKRTRNERRSTFDQDVDDEETVIGDFLFNSIYIGIPANRDPRELTAAINQELNDNATETESIAPTIVSASPSRPGSARRSKSHRLRLNRSKHHKITFELRGVNIDLVAFPPGSGETQSSVDIRVDEFEIFDHIPTSTWKKFATYMQEAGERETGTSMIHIEILNVKPIPDLAASEIVLKATILPLRLHVDQDALDFITRFFEFKDDSVPVNASPGDVPFLQRVEVNSVTVKLDFKPKRVDYAGLRSGHTTEFMNFLILEEADMVLRHTIIYGISGFDKMGKCLNDIWMPDIKRNQLPGILAGLAPVRSLVNVGGGFRHLVVVPMREYKKDGRIVRSISKGAAAFAKTTGTEVVKLGAKVAIGVQTVLQGVEGFLGSPTEASSTSFEDDESEEENKQISLYANQPVGVLQGLRGGYNGLQRDLIMARDAIIAVPGEVMEGGTAAGALRAVRKHAPTVILRPAIGIAKAGGQILMGATNSLDPVNLQRAEAKYKKH